MKTKVFTVYDSKVKAYLSPFFHATAGSAIRAWETTIQDKDCPFARHPGDYTLFEIGVYDDETANLEMLKAHLNLGTALQYVRKDNTLPMFTEQKAVNV